MLITYSLSITIITICYGYYYVLLFLLSITNQDYSLLVITITTVHSDYHYVLLSLLFITNSDSFLQSCVLHVNPSLSRKAKSSPLFLNAAWLPTQIPRMLLALVRGAAGALLHIWGASVSAVWQVARLELRCGGWPASATPLTVSDTGSCILCLLQEPPPNAVCAFYLDIAEH